MGLCKEYGSKEDYKTNCQSVDCIL